MKPVILNIDSSGSEKTTIMLTVNGNMVSKTSVSRRVKTQSVLPLIETLLTENNITVSQITRIQVDEGPGSYTGLRVGAAIGNTLSQLLNIPINGHKPGSGISLTYTTYT